MRTIYCPATPRSSQKVVALKAVPLQGMSENNKDIQQHSVARYQSAVNMFASMFFPKIFARADDDGDQPATDPNSSPHNAENGVVENDGTAKTLDVALTTSNTSAETQAGVREIEAVTQVWTKGNMIAAYVL